MTLPQIACGSRNDAFVSVWVYHSEGSRRHYFHRALRTVHLRALLLEVPHTLIDWRPGRTIVCPWLTVR